MANQVYKMLYNEHINYEQIHYSFPQSCEHAQLLSNSIVAHSLEFSIVDVMKMQPFYG